MLRHVKVNLTKYKFSVLRSCLHFSKSPSVKDELSNPNDTDDCASQICNGENSKEENDSLSLNLSNLEKKIKNKKQIPSIVSKIKDEFIFPSCDLNIINTLNIRNIYDKYFSMDDLLKLTNIEKLIVTCKSSDKEVLLNNLYFLHNEANIKTIIIEEFVDYFYDDNRYNKKILKEILICTKDCIQQFIGTSYSKYYENNFQYKSVNDYLNTERAIYSKKSNFSRLRYYYDEPDEDEDALFDEECRHYYDEKLYKKCFSNSSKKLNEESDEDIYAERKLHEAFIKDRTEETLRKAYVKSQMFLIKT
jgi:hypothetical protein